jgi:hypothetical protein
MVSIIGRLVYVGFSRRGYPDFLEARFSASTARAFASAARRRSSDAGSVIRRRLRMTRGWDAGPGLRPRAGLPSTLSTAWPTRARTECNLLFSRTSD